jgi:hypothetical protein
MTIASKADLESELKSQPDILSKGGDQLGSMNGRQGS